MNEEGLIMDKIMRGEKDVDLDPKTL